MRRLDSTMADSAVLTVREVADLLKVDVKTVYRLARGNQLPGFKVAGTWRFKNVDLDQWIEKQKKAAGRPMSGNNQHRTKQ
jgi:excisionase family DNA binding protein